MENIGKKRVVWVVVTNDLVTDQRVNKVSLTLQKVGFEPRLLGIMSRKNTSIQRGYPVHRMKMLFHKSFFFYAEYNIRLFFKLLFSKFDVVLANDTDTLVGAYLAARFRRKPIVFDAHELFPEVPELVGRPFVKRIWELIEQLIIPRIKYGYTVCQPIADIYREKFNIEMGVVRNAPMLTLMPHLDEKPYDFGGKKMILYQGAVNVGRGIEWVIDAMPYLDNVVYCIAGSGDVFEEIEAKIERMNLQDRVILLGRIPMEELYRYTVSADLGLCLLENRGLNYYYSLPNRIFDFALAGVPILATDFPEIRNVVESYHLGALTSSSEPVDLAREIMKILNESEHLIRKNDIFAQQREQLSWENEEKVIFDLFNKL
jgi:glycosyltransferase involved in cell wall biosynthesis